MENSRICDCVIAIEVEESQECDAKIHNFDVACPISNGIATKSNPVLTQRVLGIVEWSHVKNGYGFLYHRDTREDICVR